MTREIATYAPQLAGHAGYFGMSLVTFVTLLLFLGATGKSAQIPLHVWLPDAMAGPTPVSALIHAATMVTAGVYMVARLNFLFSMAPATMRVIATVGGLTALFAATIGITQTDIKKVLAYSTISQLGYMFVGVGVGAYAAGVFPSDDARVLQGLPVSRRRIGDPCDGRRAGHAQDGRFARKIADYVLDVSCRDARDLRQCRRSPASCRRTRLSGARSRTAI